VTCAACCHSAVYLQDYNYADVLSTHLDSDHPAMRHEATQLQMCADIANLHPRIIRIINTVMDRIDTFRVCNSLLDGAAR